MSDTVDPPRLIDDPESALLRDAMRSAQKDLPAASTVEAMLARFPSGPVGGPSGPSHPPGGPSAPPTPIAGVPTATGAIAKAVGALLVVGGLSVGAYYGTRSEVPSSPPAIQASASLVASSPEAFSAPPSISSLAEAPSAPPSTPRSPRPSANAVESDPRTEMDLLREAQASLASNPAHALALANESQTRFPRGALGQERDMIRIQALLGQGRVDEARALADDFKRRHPDSAHNSRLSELFP